MEAPPPPVPAKTASQRGFSQQTHPLPTLYSSHSATIGMFPNIYHPTQNMNKTHDNTYNNMNGNGEHSGTSGSSANNNPSDTNNPLFTTSNISQNYGDRGQGRGGGGGVSAETCEKTERDDDALEMTPTARAKVLPWVRNVHSPNHGVTNRSTTTINGDNVEHRPPSARPGLNHRPPTWMIDQEAERARLEVEYEQIGSRPLSMARPESAKAAKNGGVGQSQKGMNGRASHSDFMSRGAGSPGTGGAHIQTGPKNMPPSGMEQGAGLSQNDTGNNRGAFPMTGIANATAANVPSGSSPGQFGMTPQFAWGQQASMQIGLTHEKTDQNFHGPVFQPQFAFGVPVLQPILGQGTGVGPNQQNHNALFGQVGGARPWGVPHMQASGNPGMSPAYPGVSSESIPYPDSPGQPFTFDPNWIPVEDPPLGQTAWHGFLAEEAMGNPVSPALPQPKTAPKIDRKVSGVSGSSSNARTANHGLTPAAREQREADADEITRLKERMKQNAELSRAALAKEKADREHERKKALNILAALEKTEEEKLNERTATSPRSKQSNNVISPHTHNSIYMQSGAPKATFLHTDMGDIKTYEKIVVVPSEISRPTSEQGRVTMGDIPLPQGQGKRETQQTSTTETSFGHFGRPFSHQLQPKGRVYPSPIAEAETEYEVQVPIVFMHSTSVPFGIPLGLGFGEMITEAPRQHDKRSAYVETIEDEESPRTPRIDTHNSCSPPLHEAKESCSGDQRVVPNLNSEQSTSTLGASPKDSAISVRGSAVDAIGPPDSPPAQNTPSVFTTASLVDRLVRDSLHHDDILCQLLIASKEDRIGEPARKALRRAAKERVIELSRRGQPETRMDQHQSHPDAHGQSSPSNKILISQSEPAEPGPPWSRALFEMLAEATARLDDLDIHLHEALDAKHGRRRNKTQTVLSHEHETNEAAARAALHNLLFPDHPVEIPVVQEIAPSDTEKSRSARTVSCHRRTPSPGRHPPPSINVQPPTADHSQLDDGRTSSRTRQSLMKGGANPSSGVAGRENLNEILASSNFPPGISEAQWVFPKPWDVVTQRLYSWALVWMQEDFMRALEHIALGHQVDEFALTIYMMMISKRNLRHRLCSVPPLPCDKLFVPPNMADALNRAVHAKRYGDAQQILEELWWPFGFKHPPRVIVALAKHRNDSDHWAALRFDLPSGRLVTLSFSSTEKSLIDGRPFMWWHSIRSAWPEHNIPHPDNLAMKTQRTIFSEKVKGDNSLAAANAARNFMLGWRPERPADLNKMRERVWQEIKRLYSRKLAGKLIINVGDELA